MYLQKTSQFNSVARNLSATGGEGRIRTCVDESADLQSAAFDHSATSP